MSRPGRVGPGGGLGELEATAAEGMAAAVGCDVDAALGMAAAVRVGEWWVARGGKVGVQVCAYSSGGGGGPVNGDGCGAPPGLRLHTPLQRGTVGVAQPANST